MKQTLLIALLLFSLQVKSQTKKPVDSFLGIKFGSSAAQVTAVLKAKGVTIDEKNSTPGFMAFDNVVLGGRSAYIFYVRFIDDKAFQATFIFQPEDKYKVVEYYSALMDEITEAYGTGKSYKTIKDPFTESTVYYAFATGDADYSTYWIDGENAVKEKIRKDRSVELTYQDGVLFDLSKKQKKDTSEF